MKNTKLFIILLSSILVSCSQNNTSSEVSNETSEEVTTVKNYRENIREVDQICGKELYASFKFFYENISTTERGYGLIPDRYNINNNTGSNYYSIASIGYGLACLPIGVEHNWISNEQGLERTLKTLQTLENIETVHGFYYHFLNANGQKFSSDIEVSVIDTAILINGCLVAGKYFGGECYSIACRIYEKIEWEWYYNEDIGKFYMGYKPNSGFSGSWNEYAEQLMMYVLAAGSPTHKVGKAAYDVMKRLSKISSKTADYDPFYLTYTGSLFTYQFSHAFIDFNHEDESGVNWFTNSINASKAAVAYAKTQQNNYKTFQNGVWGLTASDGPNGYTGAYGSKPCSGKNKCDGTIAPCAAVGSIVFTPEKSIAAMKEFIKDQRLWSKYGFIDAYNLGTTETYTDNSINVSSKGWFDSDVIGIDKGVGALMIENYISGMIWNITNDIPYYQNGLKELTIR